MSIVYRSFFHFLSFPFSAHPQEAHRNSSFIYGGVLTCGRMTAAFPSFLMRASDVFLSADFIPPPVYRALCASKYADLPGLFSLPA